MRTKISNKRRGIEHALLFPGTILSKRVHKVQYATQIVGEVFERLSKSLAGNQWARLIPVSDDDIRPDLGTEDGLNYIESKSTQWRFKVTTNQLNHYKNLVEDHAKLALNCNVCYYLWTYGDKTIKLVKHGKTCEGVIRLCMDNVVSVDILHWTILYQMFNKLPPNVTYNEYSSWKVAIARGESFKVMQFGSPFLNRLRENPAKTLFSELSLNPEKYDLKTCAVKEARRSIVFDGVRFQSRRFQINRYVPISGYVECPELQNIKRDEIPI